MDSHESTGLLYKIFGKRVLQWYVDSSDDTLLCVGGGVVVEEEAEEKGLNVYSFCIWGMVASGCKTIIYVFMDNEERTTSSSAMGD